MQERRTMSFPWFKKSRQASPTFGSKRRRSLPLWLEKLEDRTVPAVGTNFSVNTVAGLYFDVLHREASQAELTSWSQAMDAGLSQASVAQMFVGSQENLQAQAQG